MNDGTRFSQSIQRSISHCGNLLADRMGSKSNTTQTSRLNMFWSGLQLEELTLSGELEERCEERPRLVVVPPYSDLGLGGSVDELWSI